MSDFKFKYINIFGTPIKEEFEKERVINMNQQKLLKLLYEEYKIKFNEKEIVTGDGNAEAKILLIGEAPGKDEVLYGKPFVGNAGKKLAEFLDVLSLTRDDIFITNSIKYRLSRINDKTGRTINRPATKNEIIENQSYLAREIEIIKPEYILTLGNIPLRSITGDFSINIGEKHGNVSEIIIRNKKYKLFPLYHPAAIIYNRQLEVIYIEDIQKLKKILNKAK